MAPRQHCNSIATVAGAGGGQGPAGWVLNQDPAPAGRHGLRPGTRQGHRAVAWSIAEPGLKLTLNAILQRYG